MPKSVYVGCPVNQVENREAFEREYEMLLQALTLRGYDVRRFIGSDRNATNEDVALHDLRQVSEADLVLAIHPCPSTGLGIEIDWKARKFGHVIFAVPEEKFASGLVSRLALGMHVVNPNHKVATYTELSELVDVVDNHFQTVKALPRPKLVRDNIPAQIAAQGKTPICRIATSEEIIDLLLEKLVEEAGEARTASSDRLLAELADVHQVLEELMPLLLHPDGKTLRDFRKLQLDEREERGGFRQGYVLEDIKES